MSATAQRVRRVRAGKVDAAESFFHTLTPQTTAAEEEAHYDELGNQDEAEASHPWPPLHRQNYRPLPASSPWKGAACILALVAVWTAFLLQYFGVWTP